MFKMNIKAVILSTLLVSAMQPACQKKEVEAEPAADAAQEQIAPAGQEPAQPQGAVDAAQPVAAADNVWVCHPTGNPTQAWEKLEIARGALAVHLARGDVVIPTPAPDATNPGLVKSFVDAFTCGGAVAPAAGQVAPAAGQPAAAAQPAAAHPAAGHAADHQHKAGQAL